MKIAFIGQKGIPAKFGGVERHIEGLATEMAKNGHEVFVYARNNYTPKELKEYKGVRIIHLPSIATKNLDAISHTFLATIHALFHDYDVIHFQAIGPALLSWIIKIFKRKTLLVTTFHCQDYYHKKWGKLAQLSLKVGEYLTCKVPDKTVVVSDSLEEYTKNKYKINPAVIYNGTYFKEAHNPEILKKFNLENKKYVVFVSRLIKHKGAHYLVEAFKAINRENRNSKNLKLVIVGDGFFTDGYVKYLKELSAGEKNIIFTGNLEGEELRTVFSSAYLFVQPSETEGLSLSLLEAMSCGVPVLASNIRENVDVIGDLGETFETKNVADLERKLKQFLNDEIDFNDKVIQAKKLVQEKYNWEIIAQKTINLYQEGIREKNKTKQCK